MLMKTRQLPEFITRLEKNESDPVLGVARMVWGDKGRFVRWPDRAYRFWPGLTRAPGSGRRVCYTYSVEQLKAISSAGLAHRAWTNDPAIYAYKLAGGERPRRVDGKWEWTVHHIYDGKFPAFPHQRTTHAVNHPDYFTEAAGLVAVHPVAEALASEIPYFAWMLRFEAFRRFNFDPDGVFENPK
jgi:hypothetical protein